MKMSRSSLPLVKEGFDFVRPNFHFELDRLESEERALCEVNHRSAPPAQRLPCSLLDSHVLALCEAEESLVVARLQFGLHDLLLSTCHAHLAGHLTFNCSSTCSLRFHPRTTFNSRQRQALL